MMAGVKNRPFHRRLRYALAGIAAAFRSESSFRIQCAFALAAPLALIALGARAIWWAVITLTVGAVLAAELLNTALEALADQLHPEQHPLIARAKDCAAGAVAVLSLAAIGVGVAMVIDTL